MWSAISWDFSVMIWKLASLKDWNFKLIPTKLASPAIEARLASFRALSGLFVAFTRARTVTREPAMPAKLPLFVTHSSPCEYNNIHLEWINKYSRKDKKIQLLETLLQHDSHVFYDIPSRPFTRCQTHIP